MKKPKKELFSTITGIILVLYAVMAIITYYKSNTLQVMLWICDHTALIIGLAFIFKKWFWVGAEINLMFIPQLLWTIDYFYRLFSGKFIFSFTDYMFEPFYDKGLYFLGLGHIFIIPIALIGLFLAINALKKKEKKSAKKSISLGWKGSLLHLILLLPPSYLFANGDNYNCATSCFTFIPTTLLYKIIWPFVIIVMVILTGYLLNQSLKLLKK